IVRRGLVVGLMGLAGALQPGAARACGCLAPPNPAEPVVQAGERILFAVKDSQVTAHIQIQYAGNAAEFGWLLPLPSLPTLEVGSDELFSALLNRTQPKYRLNRIFPQNGCFFGGGQAGGGVDLAAAGAFDGGMNNGGPPSPLVVQDSIGPFDYAVLKADDKSAMLMWL